MSGSPSSGPGGPDGEPPELPSSREEFLEAMDRTPLGELFRDEARLDAMMQELMRGSSDDIAKEIGDGLADGSLRREDLRSSAYSEWVRRNLERIGELDTKRVLGDYLDQFTGPDDGPSRSSGESDTRGRRHDE